MNDQVYHKMLEQICSLSSVYPCQYFTGRSARMKYFHCNQPLKGDFVDFLLSRGFRRCGALFYVYACQDCNACTPYRIPVELFVPNRTQKKVWRKNESLKIEACSNTAPDEEHSLLYLKYYRSRHAEFNSKLSQDMSDEEVLEAMNGQMYESFGNTFELNYFDSETLVAFTTVDAGDQSLSAVYTAFDPAYSKQSPGVFSILKMIGLAKEQKLKYLYLGLYIKDHPKMDYKSGYTPAEIRDENGNWRMI